MINQNVSPSRKFLVENAHRFMSQSNIYIQTSTAVRLLVTFIENAEIIN